MKTGRKWFDGKCEADVISKLSYVWSIGGSDAEAAFYADISPASLSRYLESNPKVSERKQALKENPILKAREAVHKAIINGEHDLALKYLERKRKEEFGERKEIVLDDSKRQEWARAAVNNPELSKQISELMAKIAQPKTEDK